MPTVSRVRASDTQIFFDDVRISGLQSSNIETSREYEEIRPLGRLSNRHKVLTSNQSSTISFDYLALQDGFDPFNETFLSIDKREIKIKDLAGEVFASGCYLSSCALNFNVGEVVKGSMSFVSDGTSHNEVNALTPQDQTEDSNAKLFRPQEINFSGHENYGEALNACDGNVCSFCVQSASITIDIEREAVNVVGQRVPLMRYPVLPINGSVSFEVLKTDVTGLDLSPVVCETGSLYFSMASESKGYSTQYEIKGCSLNSISENLDLDGNSTLSFEYDFPLDNNSINLSKVG